LKKLSVPLANVKSYFLKSTPMFLNEVMWALGMTTLVQCYSTRGLDVIASLNISNTLMNTFNSSLMAMGAAIGIIVGNLLGSDDIKGAKSASLKLTVFSFILCIGMGGIMAGVSPVFPLIYKTTADVQALATVFIIVASCAMPIESVCNSCYFTIRAGGKTFITFLFDSLFVWCVSVPLAYCLSRFTDIYIVWLYIILYAINIIKAVIGLIMMKSGIWCNNMNKEHSQEDSNC